MRVLDDEQYRLAPGQPEQLIEQDLEGAHALLLQADRELAIALLAIEAEQRRDQMGLLRRRVERLLHQRLQLVEPGRVAVVGLESGGQGQLLDRRVERAVRVVRRALMADTELVLPGHRVDQRVNHP